MVLPWTLSMRLKVEKDARVEAQLEIPVNSSLKPNESYSTPRSFVAVYSSDFYQPQRMWWVATSLGLATAAALWIYDKTIQPRSNA